MRAGVCIDLHVHIIVRLRHLHLLVEQSGYPAPADEYRPVVVVYMITFSKNAPAQVDEYRPVVDDGDFRGHS